MYCVVLTFRPTMQAVVQLNRERKMAFENQLLSTDKQVKPVFRPDGFDYSKRQPDRKSVKPFFWTKHNYSKWRIR